MLSGHPCRDIYLANTAAEVRRFFNLLLDYNCTRLQAEQVRNTNPLAAKHSTSSPTSPHLPLPWLCVCAHRRCVTAKVLDHIGSVSNLEGFSGLRKEDQARVRRAFELGYVEECREVEDKVRVCLLCVRTDISAYSEPIPGRVC